MIRKFESSDLDVIMQIWLDTNIKAHEFIPTKYWEDNFDMVKSVLPRAEVYIYENDATKQIDGFIGLDDGYVAGIFVREGSQSKGIGKKLLDYAKNLISQLSLSVYKKNVRAIQFYLREQFVVQSENVDESTGEIEHYMIWER